MAASLSGWLGVGILAGHLRSVRRPAASLARPTSAYNPAIVGSYRANETRWLPQGAAQRMEAAAANVQHQIDASTYSRQIAERFLIELSWASSSLEGNTYNYLETEALIKFGAAASGHDLAEATMIVNHKKAIITLLEKLNTPLLNVESISRLHALLMRDALWPEELGRIRRSDVRIGGSSYRPSSDPVQLQADFGGLLGHAEQVENPFEASFLLLAGIPYIQPFSDGNKRSGRLACNFPLLKAGVPPMSFISLDKANYLAGLILFYETGDISLLAEVVADGYVAAVPSYAAAVAVGRQPRSVELRERHGIERAIQSLVQAAIADESNRVDEEVTRRFPNVSAEDKAVLTESIDSALKALNEVNAPAWGVAPEIAAKYAEKRTTAEQSNSGFSR